ncbi:DUF4435 domain-containing protein, partial [Candidatus Poribacteria bacterium]|nr:DUF4435 domain-containing protein [Candidatus Poribacteria bacterium]
PKILVYVEGYSDLPFYEEVLQNYDYHLKARGGKEECKKLVTALVEKDLPYVVVLDGDYEILTRKRSQHRRVVWLHRYSFENYLFEEKPIKQFCRDRTHSEDSLEEALTNSELADFTHNIEVKFKDLLILDVAHQRSKTGQKTFFRRPDRFFKEDFRDNEIQRQQEAAAKNIHPQSIIEAKNLVDKYLTERRLIDLLPGRFAFGIMRRLISNTVGTSISNDEIRLYISRVVWRSVNTRDHNSLKRRLRSAVRKAEKIRHAQK